MLKADIHHRPFTFSFPARTSRGPLTTKSSWFILLWDDDQPQKIGVGECGPLPGLSIEYSENLPAQLDALIHTLNQHRLSSQDLPDDWEDLYFFLLRLFPNANLSQHSSILFALETAFWDLITGAQQLLFPSPFTAGTPIPIHGLIWMGSPDFMMSQIEEKIKTGFTCLKIKIGGLNFKKECDLLHTIRQQYSSDKIAIRLDANGAFSPSHVIKKLNRLASFDIHSIEQPLAPGLREWSSLCKKSPIPIALDESLIGLPSNQKSSILNTIQPHYLVLKPSLHGGLSGCKKWIYRAQTHNMGWWITSALESNIGLNAIAQFVGQYRPNIFQGLGTGQLFHSNFHGPLNIKNGSLFFDISKKWKIVFP